MNETRTETAGDVCLIRDALAPRRWRLTAYERPGVSRVVDPSVSGVLLSLLLTWSGTTGRRGSDKTG